MTKKLDQYKAIFDVWGINNSVTIFLVEHIPADLWNEKVPGFPQKTVGRIASHIHNTRCMWIRMIGQGEIVRVPHRIGLHGADSKKVVEALYKSGAAISKLLKACTDNGGKLPFKPAWLNFPNDIIHLVTYLTAHEAHHRGQIIMSARQLNHRFPEEVTTGVWQWTKRLKEIK